METGPLIYSCKLKYHLKELYMNKPFHKSKYQTFYMNSSFKVMHKTLQNPRFKSNVLNITIGKKALKQTQSIKRYNHSREYTVAFVLKLEGISLIVLLVSRYYSFQVTVSIHHLYRWSRSIIDKGRKINICLQLTNQIQWLSQ